SDNPGRSRARCRAPCARPRSARFRDRADPPTGNPNPSASWAWPRASRPLATWDTPCCAHYRPPRARLAHAARAGFTRLAPKKTSVSVPILCGAGYAVFSSFPLAQNEGMEHRVAHQSSVLPHSLLKSADASRRSIAAFLSPGPRFLVCLAVSAGFGAIPFWADDALAIRSHCKAPSPAKLLAERP